MLVIGAVTGGAIVNAVGDSGGSRSEIVIGVEESASQSDLLIDVQGEVEQPGVVVLAPGARVLDAVAASGGFTDEAAAGSVNLAREVVDGEQIIVPSASESAANDAGAAADGRISINRATAEQLQALPRVGPAVSSAIVAHRDQHGPFTSIDQLEDVSGIGPSMMEQLRELVTL